MHQLYLVLGYGTPKDITKDSNYQTYLRMVVNAIYSDCTQNPRAVPWSVFSGGLTSMFRPYRKTEAGEMMRGFRALLRTRGLRKASSQWRLLAEARSLSTLENLVFSKVVLRTKRVTSGQLTIFCEHTREKRIWALARLVFGSKFRVTVHPVDFDTSSNRYLAPDFLKQKERTGLKRALWALKSKANFLRYRAMYRNRLTWLRHHTSARHDTAVQAWWEKEWAKQIGH